MIVIHGYGSSGTGGGIKQTIRRHLEGVHVSFDKDLIHWQVRDPMSTSGYENYDAWNAAAKTIRYSFNKEAMIHNISDAIDSIKNKSHNSAEFLFNLNTYLT
jgi:hypothetical protein